MYCESMRLNMDIMLKDILIKKLRLVTYVWVMVMINVYMVLLFLVVKYS